jgi:hypothetical protein
MTTGVLFENFPSLAVAVSISHIRAEPYHTCGFNSSLSRMHHNSATGFHANVWVGILVEGLTMKFTCSIPSSMMSAAVAPKLISKSNGANRDSASLLV